MTDKSEYIPDPAYAEREHGHGHHPHHRTRHRHHGHHEHSGTTGDVGDTYNDTTHVHGDTIINQAAQPAQSALETCLAALRGLGTVKDCESVLGHVISALVHSGHLSGISAPFEAARSSVNHYLYGSDAARGHANQSRFF